MELIQGNCAMRNKILVKLFGLLLIITLCGDTWSDDGRYPIMKPDMATYLKWIESYENAPKAFINGKLNEKVSFGNSYSLLSHLKYIPDERDQGWFCNNCLVWAATGVMEIAHSVQTGINDRLSIQYVNSCKAGRYACCGESLLDFAIFYSLEGQTIPWSNTDAYYQDSYSICLNGSSYVSCDSISKKPSYPILYVIPERLAIHNVDHSRAIANIKNVLHQNKGLLFGFFLANDDDWDNFFDFWDDKSEDDIWNPDYSCGHTWVDGEGGSHVALLVGYNDDAINPYWILLNSWGTAKGSRPNALFRMDMNINYGCRFYYPAMGMNFYSHILMTLNIKFCPAEEVLNNDKEKMNTLRTLRNTIIDKTLLGYSLITPYYRHADEIYKILRANKKINMMTANVVEKIVEKATALNSKGASSIDKELVESILEIAKAINLKSSPELSVVIGQVKKEIRRGDIFKQLGITISE